MLKNLLSYIIPINIFRKTSVLSKKIEITLINGKLVLYSENTNYSFGNLQKILNKGIKHIGFETI